MVSYSLSGYPWTFYWFLIFLLIKTKTPFALFFTAELKEKVFAEGFATCFEAGMTLLKYNQRLQLSFSVTGRHEHAGIFLF